MTDHLGRSVASDDRLRERIERMTDADLRREIEGAVRSGIPLQGGCLCGGGHRVHCPAIIADRLAYALADLLAEPRNAEVRAAARRVLRESLVNTRVPRPWVGED